MAEEQTVYYVENGVVTGTGQIPVGSPMPTGYVAEVPSGTVVPPNLTNYYGQAVTPPVAPSQAPSGYSLGSIPSIGSVWIKPDPNNVGGGQIVDPTTGNVKNYQVDAMGHYVFTDPNTGEIIGTNIGAGQGTQLGYPTNAVPTQLKVPTAVSPTGIGRIPTIDIPTVIEPTMTPPDLSNLQSQIDAATERYN